MVFKYIWIATNEVGYYTSPNLKTLQSRYSRLYVIEKGTYKLGVF